MDADQGWGERSAREIETSLPGWAGGGRTLYRGIAHLPQETEALARAGWDGTPVRQRELE